jgi:catechol 2,3-dioxygenase
MPAPAIDPGARIGHVHLKVAHTDRALDFYCGVLGFQLMQRRGPQAAFISAGGHHHHIGLNSWESRDGSPPPPGSIIWPCSIRRAPHSPMHCGV